MLTSMTGYGFSEIEHDDLRIAVEIRSVNHRFCEVQVRIPKDYLALESRIIARVKNVCQRGRIDVLVRRVTQANVGGSHLEFNASVIQLYLRQLTSLKQSLGLVGEIDLNLLLSLDGASMAVEDTRDAESDWQLVSSALDAALAAAHGLRSNEGETLQRDFLNRFQRLAELHERIDQATQANASEVRARMLDRVKHVLSEVGSSDLDATRVLQEVVLLVERSDITEEIIRLGSHLGQLRLAIDETQPVGRKIEFLLQELGREANTIGSKSPHVHVTQLAMDFKLELEKIREQVQNVE